MIGTVPINLIIILKEIQIEFFLISDRKFEWTDEFALGLIDLFKVFVFGPFDIVTAIWAYFRKVIMP